MFKRILIDYKLSLIERKVNQMIEDLTKENISILKWLEYTNIYFANSINYREIPGLKEKLANTLLDANVITKNDEEIEILDVIAKELESSLIKTEKKIIVNKSELRKVI